MAESIASRSNCLSKDVERDLRPLLEASLDDQDLVVADITAMRTKLAAAIADITAMRAAIVAITAKLDADAGVTDVNYASTCNPAAQTSSTPAAQTSTTRNVTP